MSGGDYRAALYHGTIVAIQSRATRLGNWSPSDGVVTDAKLAKSVQTLVGGTVSDEHGAHLVADVHIKAIGRGRPGVSLPSMRESSETGTFRTARGTYWQLHAHAF